MKKNFDDFIKWCEEDPDTARRSSMLANNVNVALGNIESREDLILKALTFFEDMIMEDLRAYHEWLHQA